MASSSLPSAPPLRLLSLDGGGVRGLSSLIILKHLMRSVDSRSPPKPCEYFDLIGGTSTGGLIAIMLGRLQMDVDTCIEKYCELSLVAFEPKRGPLNLFARAKDVLMAGGAYSSSGLVSEIKSIVKSIEGNTEAELINPDTHCKVFVCANTTNPRTAIRFRSYSTPEKAVQRLANSKCTIWQAARATTAAPTFFKPIEIGRQSFVDGAIGLNNPVEEVHNEATLIWPDALSRIQCLVSIGTGVPNLLDIGSNLKGVVDTLKAIATETEETEKRVFRSQERLGISGRYFRYNVPGLGGVGLDEHKEADRIIGVTESYLEEQRIRITIDDFLASRASNELSPLDKASRDKCLSWLRCSDSSEYYVSARQQATKSTGNWFIEGEFNAWKAKPKSILWLHGKAGCGKTILTSTIINEIKNAKLGSLAYFYFSFQRKKEDPQDLVGLVQTLLVQIVKGLIRQDPTRTDRYHLPEAFRRLYDDDDNQLSSRLEIEKLKPAFLGVLAESKETYIVIDALDECPEPEDQEKVVDFLIWLSRSVRSSTHILIASRREGNIEDAISQVPPEDLCMVSIQDRKANHDIRRHLQTRMEEDSVFKTWDHGVQTRVVEGLTQKADGVFRWAKCQLDTLRKLRERTTREDIENALKDLPKDLDETYHRMLLSVNEGRFASEARAVLRWLAASERPLRLSEAAEAAVFCNSGGGSVSVSLEKRFKTALGIRNILSGLVTVSGLDDRPHAGNEGTDDWHGAIITFAHFSVKEYLECDRVKPVEFRLLESNSRRFILKSCLAYIHHYDNQPHKKAGSEQLPLLLYACKYWPHHAMALYRHGDQAVKKLAKLLAIHKGPTLTLSAEVALGLKDRQFQETLSTPLRNWLKSVEGKGSYGELNFDFEDPLALHLASDIGEKRLVKLMLDCGADVNKAGYGGRAALHHAAFNGHEVVVQQLLQAGANIEVKDYGRGTPLASAIENGYNVVIKLLLVKGAKVDYGYVPDVGDLHPDPSYR